jgi:hypothetical protein
MLSALNKAFADWGEVFPNAACVVSLVDRLVHRAKEAQERLAARAKQRLGKTATGKAKR